MSLLFILYIKNFWGAPVLAYFGIKVDSCDVTLNIHLVLIPNSMRFLKKVIHPKIRTL